MDLSEVSAIFVVFFAGCLINKSVKIYRKYDGFWINAPHIIVTTVLTVVAILINYLQFFHP